jgi:hypothetical protein
MNIFWLVLKEFGLKMALECRQKEPEVESVIEVYEQSKNIQLRQWAKKFLIDWTEGDQFYRVLLWEMLNDNDPLDLRGLLIKLTINENPERLKCLCCGRFEDIKDNAKQRILDIMKQQENPDWLAIYAFENDPVELEKIRHELTANINTMADGDRFLESVNQSCPEIKKELLYSLELPFVGDVLALPMPNGDKTYFLTEKLSVLLIEMRKKVDDVECQKLKTVKMILHQMMDEFESSVDKEAVWKKIQSYFLEMVPKFMPSYGGISLFEMWLTFYHYVIAEREASFELESMWLTRIEEVELDSLFTPFPHYEILRFLPEKSKILAIVERKAIAEIEKSDHFGVFYEDERMNFDNKMIQAMVEFEGQNGRKGWEALQAAGPQDEKLQRLITTALNLSL